MAPQALTQVLRPLADLFPADQFPQVMVGLRPSDDAAVYRVSPDQALVVTVDFFTPIVDDPYAYGAIAAANALSDVYAMGAKPVLALNVSCLSGCLPPEAVTSILRGGADKVREAGAALVGGHSIDDKEPKYGLVALGFVHPEHIWTKTAARPGDVLILTKPLGVGVITTAAKRDLAAAEHLYAAIESMLRLNAAAVEPLQHAGVSAATDVTGFALVGSAVEIAERSHCSFRLLANRIPLLPGAATHAAAGVLPGGTRRNRAAFDSQTRIAPDVPSELVSIFFTPETSGGLLACVRADKQRDVLAALAKAGVPASVIGEVVDAQGSPTVEILAG